jgi:hypothetical protein
MSFRWKNKSKDDAIVKKSEGEAKKREKMGFEEKTAN